jgi:hypothetical protein
MNCEVCGSEKSVTEVEMLSHSSFYCCDNCYQFERVPWDLLVGEVISLGLSRSQNELGHAIEATCNFYGRTVGDLFGQVEVAQNEYNQLQERDA